MPGWRVGAREWSEGGSALAVETAGAKTCRWLKESGLLSEEASIPGCDLRYEGRDFVDGLDCFGEGGVAEVPDVRHLGVDPQADVDAGLAGAARESRSQA